MTLEEIIGSNVRGFRKRLGWTQERLAEVAELHPTYVGDIERSNANLSIDTLKKLSKALQVEAHVLLLKGAFMDAEVYQVIAGSGDAKKRK
ncbi:MAG: helix-turn-helix transcriptional regulator [Bacteroidetes bacterium]|nr:helix-turn-helix transcriptional regulator [Bacteroidota bacterium]